MDKSAYHELSLFDSLALVVGCTIGLGIFIVSAGIARDVRSPALLLLVWIAAGLMSLSGTLTIAELAAMMPAAGGHYVFQREAYGETCAFLFGCTIIAVIHTGSIAAVGMVFAKYLGVLVPAVHAQLHFFTISISGERLVAIGLILLLTITNSPGLRTGRAVQNLFTITKLAAIALIVLFALVISPNHAALRAKFGSASAFLGAGKLSFSILPAFGAAMVGALFSLGGADNLLAAAASTQSGALIANLADRRRLPGDCPYLLINLAYLAQLPLLGEPASSGVFARGIAGADSGRVAGATMAMLWGSAGEVLTALLVMMSTLGCINGFILGGGRLIFAMAHDRMFFRIASRLNQASVPAFALAIQAIWCSVLVLSGDFSDLLNYMGAAGALFGFLSVAAVFAMRIKHPEASRPYRAWGYPYIPALNLLGSPAILVDLIAVRPRYSLFGLLIVAAGLPIHLWQNAELVD